MRSSFGDVKSVTNIKSLRSSTSAGSTPKKFAVMSAIVFAFLVSFFFGGRARFTTAAPAAKAFSAFC
jgi:hypothetical protein